MGPRWILIVAALSGFIGVGIGALGAHGLPDYLDKKGFDEAKIAKKLDQCEIGVRYQMIHTLAILAVGVSGIGRRSALARASCGMFLAGSVFFSGGLYSIVYADFLGHWSIVPLGGMMFLIGWLLLALLGLMFREPGAT